MDIEKWRIHYNTKRPHSSLGYRPPAPLTIVPNPIPLDVASKMTYTINKLLTGTTLAEAEKNCREALAQNGFGVLTEIDVQATMHKKLGINLPGYKILGACNPQMAYKAIELEPRVGAMLPCNVILREVNGGTEISAIDPVASMQAIDSPELLFLAQKVRQLLESAVQQS